MNPSNPQRPEIRLENIEQAALMIQKSRPSYGPIIDFYSQVFIAFEQSQGQIQIEPLIIDDNLLKLKFDNGMPLIDPSQFIIDFNQAQGLMEKLIDLCENYVPKLAPSAGKLKRHLNELDLKSLAADILEDGNRSLERTAVRLDLPLDVLMFFVFLSITPSLKLCSTQLSTYLREAPEFRKGYCPVCGSRANSGYLDQDGKRYLVCSLCSHEWHSNRMGCVFCDCSDNRLQHYFFNEQEKEYRVYLCDNCKNYLKVIDLRALDRVFIPGLEQIATLHLDMKAKQKGYTSPTPGFEEF